MLFRCLIVLAGLIAVSAPAASEEEHDEQEELEESPKTRGWAALPGLSYSPENGLTVATTALAYSRLGSDSPQPSQVKASVELSIEGNKEAALSPHLWLYDGLFKLSFRLNVTDAERSYFGIGNQARYEAREDYRSRRLSLRTRTAFRVVDALYLSVISDLQFQEIVETEEGGAIETLVMAEGERTTDSGAGLELRYDTRDNHFQARRGIKALSRMRAYARAFGSDQSFLALYNELTSYTEVAPEHVIATDLQLEYRSRGARFDTLALAGGSRLLRGMLRGRYRDHLFVGGQLEYRFPIYDRLGAVAFVGAGQVAPDIATLRLGGWKYSAGGGLRLLLSEAGVRARADLGLSDGETGFYLNLLESF